MKREEIIKTSFGETSIKVVACDNCGGGETAVTNDYYPNIGWMRMERLKTKEDGTPMPNTKEQLDFCSTDCTIRFLAPGIYDTDPNVVIKTIQNLKRIEKDLDDRPLSTT